MNNDAAAPAFIPFVAQLNVEKAPRKVRYAIAVSRGNKRLIPQQAHPKYIAAIMTKKNDVPKFREPIYAKILSIS